jgi:hypothetical protein
MHISEKAAETLHNTLRQDGVDDRDVIRLAQTDDGIALALGRPSPADETFDHQDRTILAIGPDVAPLLADATLDTAEADGETQLVLRK